MRGSEQKIEQETVAEVLKEMDVKEIVVSELDLGKIKESQDFFAGRMLASSTTGPSYIVDRLWPEEAIGQTGLVAGRLNVFNSVWWALCKKTHEILGSGVVSEKVANAKNDLAVIKQEAVGCLEAWVSTGCVDLAPQDTGEMSSGVLDNYWESVIVIASKLGVKNFSLHMPFLKNMNLEQGGKSDVFNMANMSIGGYIPTAEIKRLGIEDLEKEKRERIEETMEAAKRQIDWFGRMKQKHDIEGGNITVHLSGVGEQHRLTEEEFREGIKNLKELKKYGGENVSLLVETQGLSLEQLDRLFGEVPDQKLVFDIAHVAIESGRYGADILVALEKYKEKIGVIHFAQPERDEWGNLVDKHYSPAKKGFFDEKTKTEIIKFAQKNKIWMTFESDFDPEDLNKVKSWMV